MTSIVIEPDRHQAVIFDLDGVVTDTAAVHAAAWKQLFDDYLAQRRPDPAEDHSEFTEQDYRAHVDGRPRYDGVAAFLTSRGIELPWGSDDDPEDRETICGLGNRKNRYFQARLDDQGVTVFDSTVDLVRDLQHAGVGTAVISASRNCEKVLEVAGLSELFPVRVDGRVAKELGLPGKPDPAVFLEAAGRLGVDPAESVVVEDARAGVEAGAAGGFGLVIGVDRTGHGDELRASGADVVVSDLGEVTVAGGPQRSGSGAAEVTGGRTRPLSAIPDALDTWGVLVGVLADRHPLLILDFDGTLAPIVDDPDAAALPTETRDVLDQLVRCVPVAVVSGRDLRDVRDRVAMDGLWYAGSHGFELSGPGDVHHEHPAAEAALPALDAAERAAREELEGVPGVIVERKRYAVAVHHRQVGDQAQVRELIDVVERIGARHGLRVTGGRKVVELRPDVDWDKGRALRWLLDAIAPDDPELLAAYAGDDLTDEDALAAVADTGLGIVVRSDEHGDRPSFAHAAVDDPDAVTLLLERLAVVVCSDGPPT